jgi:glutamate dehydrogenase
MMGKFSKLTGEYTPGLITGEPIGGSSFGRYEATGCGFIYTAREAMQHLSLESKKSRAAI